MDRPPITLAGLRVLLIEDELLIADDMIEEFIGTGAIVDGPISNVEDALAAVRRGDIINLAILDVNLRGVPSYTVADELKMRGVPFLFATCYSSDSLPARFAEVACCEKPIARGRLVEVILHVTAKEHV